MTGGIIVSVLENYYSSVTAIKSPILTVAVIPGLAS
jgi:hypothetical protein